MKLNAYSIYDHKAKMYMRPFFVHNSAVATRTIADLVNDTTHEIGKHPEDYSLFFLGEWDDNTAAFDNEVGPTIVANCWELVDEHAGGPQIDLIDGDLSNATDADIALLKKQAN